MEPVDAGTPRGAPEAVAKLTVDQADLERRFGLRFTPVENDLSPAVLALARLSDGTLIGFAKLEHDPAGVDLVQYGEREPRDVLIQLLYETGLAHEQVSWLSAPRGEDDPRMWARTFDEAYLYFLMHAGKEWTDEEILDGIHASLVGDDTVMRFGDIELWVPIPPPGWSPPDKPTYSAPDDPPSTIIDAGLWVSLANNSANTAVQLLNEYRGQPIDDDLYAEIEENIVRAAAAFDESLKFVPPGADTIPVTACWSPRGLQNYRESPEAFRRENLESLAAEYRQAIGTFRRQYGSG